MLSGGERAEANPLAMNALLDPLESSNLAVEEDEESLATRENLRGRGEVLLSQMELRPVPRDGADVPPGSSGA